MSLPSINTPELIVGDLTTPIRMKKVTATSPAAEGGQLNIAHGVTASKILSIIILVWSSSTSAWSPGTITTGTSNPAGYEYYAFLGSTVITLNLHDTNSENIKSKPITILITYEAG